MKPTDILKEEHRSIERMLTLLETHAARVDKGDPPDTVFFEGAIRFIREFADGCHHGKEENLLFVRLVERGFPREAGPIAVMLGEHETGRMHLREMSGALERFTAGDNAAAAVLARHAFGYADLLRNHIYKEDNILFRMADEHLAASDQEELLRKFRELTETGSACASRGELLSLLSRFEIEAG